MPNSNDSQYVKVDIPAHHRFLNVLGASLNALLERIEGIEDREKLSYSIELALHETCTNIVEHAYDNAGGRINVCMTIEERPRQVVLDVRDKGQRFDPTQVPTPDLEQVPSRGYGLYLVRNLVDEVVYQRNGDSNWWRLVKKV